MKTLDVIVAALLIIGGLNWGLIGFFNFDLVATLFGPMSAFTRIVYCLVGLSAVYEAVGFRSIQHRWGLAAHGVTT